MSIHCLRLSLCSLPEQVNKSVSHWYEIELKISTPRYFEGQRYDLFRNDVLFFAIFVVFMDSYVCMYRYFARRRGGLSEKHCRRMYGLKSTPAAPPFTEVAFLPLLRRQLSLFDSNNKVHIKMFNPMHLFSPRHSPNGFGSALGLGRER